jgi:hypothetical protein
MTLLAPLPPGLKAGFKTFQSASIYLSLISQNLRFILAGFLILACFKLQSQSQLQSSLLKEVLHHSPNVSSLGKFGEVPVGYYTGVPNISVPIYEAISGPLKVPISLNYHAGGVKVEEVASDVGLSWALQAGGIISRSVRGIPDRNGTWGDNVASPDRVESNMPSPSVNYLKGIENGLLDGEADIYYFNFNGRSGKFILDQNGSTHIIPKANLLIAKIPFVSTGWKIVDENGTQYLFEKSEQTVEDFTESSWVLTKIISNDGKHSITFTYELGFISYEAIVGETGGFTLNSMGGCLPGAPGVQLANVSTISQRLRRIDFEAGYLQLNYFTERCDVLGDKALDEIVLYTKESKLIKKFILDHSYFGEHSMCHESQAPKKRLKLNSVTEVTPEETKPPYIFGYDESIPFPSRLSLAQDHWGYFNNEYTNKTLIPGGINGPLYNYNGAIRRANPASAQIGILKSIQYPTGGSTNFEYQNNTVGYSGIEPASYYYRSLQYVFPDPGSPVVNGETQLNVTPLVIPPGGAMISEFIVTGLDVSPWPTCDIASVYLTMNGTPHGTPLQTTEGSNLFNGFLSEGTYGLTMILDCPSDVVMPAFRVTIRVRIPDNQTNYNIPAGGIRITRIEDVPGDGGAPVVREFKYNQEGDLNSSSGVLINIPIYTSNLWVKSEVDGANQECLYLIATSQSKVPLATTSGSYVGYTFVTEVFSNGAENRYTYLNFQGSHYSIPPFAPLDIDDWKRGFLLNSKSYSKVGNQPLLVKELSNTFTEFGESSVYGIKVGRTVQNIGEGGIPLDDDGPDVFAFYETRNLFFGLGSTIEKVYPEPGNQTKVIETKKEYTYHPDHFQLIEEKETYNNGTGGKEVKVAFRKYPSDYAFTPSDPVVGDALGVKKLVNKLQEVHAVGIPVEQYVVKQHLNAQDQITNERVVSGALTTFKPGEPYPDQVYQLRTNQPVPLSDFNASTVTNNSFQKSPLYEPAIKFLAYDSKGNLLAQQNTNDVPITYLYGYDNTRPVAEVKNAIDASGTAQFPFQDYGSVQITGYLADTPLLPSFEINTGQQLISVTVGLLSNVPNPPANPLVNLILKKADGTIVSGINCEWGQHTHSILLNPGVYQWYYSTGDIAFEPGFAIDLNVSNSYITRKTGSRIFYTSFEEDGNYQQQYYTGEKAWQGEYTVYLPAQNGNYKLTYMKWVGGNPGNWEYVTQDISVTSGTVQKLTIGDTGSVIDEVRLYPAGALMTTYSYKLEFGLTAAADPNCIVTYYDYDSFGRLKHLRDYKRNIVKSYEYHYRGQY